MLQVIKQFIIGILRDVKHKMPDVCFAHFADRLDLKFEFPCFNFGVIIRTQNMRDMRIYESYPEQ